MRVLLYSDAFTPKVGGIVSSTRLLAGYLHHQGVGVVVATETAAAGPEELPFRVERGGSAQRLRSLVRDADVVHLQSFHPGILFRAKLETRKVVATVRDLSPICPKGNKWKPTGPCLHGAFPTVCVPCLRASGLPVIRRLSRPPAKAALSMFIDANVCTSGFGLHRFPLRGIRMIENGVDTDFYAPPPDGRSRNGCRIVFAGRLVPEKGVDLLLLAGSRCAKAGASFRLSVCGGGPDLARLRDIAEREGLGDRVTFHGSLGAAELLRVMQEADIAVVPSRWDEPFGLAAVEAMSCGLAVIAAEVGGLGPIVAEAGLTFPRDDVRALAAQLERVMSDAALRRDLGQAARALAIRKYDWRLMGAAYLQLYRELLGTGATAGPSLGTGQKPAAGDVAG